MLLNVAGLKFRFALPVFSTGVNIGRGIWSYSDREFREVARSFRDKDLPVLISGDTDRVLVRPDGPEVVQSAQIL